MRSGIWRMGWCACTGSFAFRGDRRFSCLTAGAPAPGALSPFLVPQAPQHGHAPPAHQNEHIPVRAVRYRVRLEGAPGQAIFPTDLLRLRARPQRRPYTLHVAEHVQEKLLKFSSLPSSRTDSGPRLPRSASSLTINAPHRRKPLPLPLRPCSLRALLPFPALSQQGVQAGIALLPCLLPGRSWRLRGAQQAR